MNRIPPGTVAPVVRLDDYRKPSEEEVSGWHFQKRFARLLGRDTLTHADLHFLDSVLRQLEGRYAT